MQYWWLDINLYSFFQISLLNCILYQGNGYKSLQCKDLQIKIATENVVLIDVRSKHEVLRTGLIPKAFILPGWINTDIYPIKIF